MQHREFLQHRRQGRVEFFKIFERQHFRRNLAKDRGAAVLLVEEIRAEPGHVRDFVTKVHVPGFFIQFDFVVGRDFVEHRPEGVVVQWRIIDPVQFAVDAEHGRIARGEVQVRGFLLEHQIEEGINFGHKRVLIFSNSDFLTDSFDHCKQCYGQPEQAAGCVQESARAGGTARPRNTQCYQNAATRPSPPHS